MHHPFALSLFLADGSADGLKIIEKSNWNGCGLSCPKKVLFEKHRKRAEFNKPGVYFLVGENDENMPSKHLYIGEADPIMPRLEEHFRKKEWWTEVIVFTTTDQTLNKAFVQYFEAQLVQLAHKTGRYCIENGNTPVVSTLSERERAICEGFLRELLLCLPLLNINLETNTQPESKENVILFVRGKGLVARGIETTDGFVVLVDSEIAIDETKTIPKPIHRLRQNLIEQGIIRKDDSGKLKFTTDHRFGSPSTASSVILGCSSNGRDAWKSQSGESLKSIQLSSLDH
jgi:hypothetical protein